MKKYESLESVIKRLSVPMLENTESNNYNRICNTIRQMYQSTPDNKKNEQQGSSNET